MKTATNTFQCIHGPQLPRLPLLRAFMVKTIEGFNTLQELRKYERGHISLAVGNADGEKDRLLSCTVLTVFEAAIEPD